MCIICVYTIYTYVYSGFMLAALALRSGTAQARAPEREGVAPKHFPSNDGSLHTVVLAPNKWNDYTSVHPFNT